MIALVPQNIEKMSILLWCKNCTDYRYSFFNIFLKEINIQLHENLQRTRDSEPPYSYKLR